MGAIARQTTTGEALRVSRRHRKSSEGDHSADRRRNGRHAADGKVRTVWRTYATCPTYGRNRLSSRDRPAAGGDVAEFSGYFDARRWRDGARTGWRSGRHHTL